MAVCTYLSNLIRVLRAAGTDYVHVLCCLLLNTAVTWPVAILWSDRLSPGSVSLGFLHQNVFATATGSETNTPLPLFWRDFQVCLEWDISAFLVLRRVRQEDEVKANRGLNKSFTDFSLVWFWREGLSRPGWPPGRPGTCYYVQSRLAWRSFASWVQRSQVMWHHTWLLCG